MEAGGLWVAKAGAMEADDRECDGLGSFGRAGAERRSGRMGVLRVGIYGTGEDK